MPGFPPDYTTSSVDNTHFHYAPNIAFAEDAPPLGAIGYQDEHDSIGSLYNPSFNFGDQFDDTTLPFDPIGYTPSSLDDVPAFSGQESTLFNSPSIDSANPLPGPTSTYSSSKPSPDAPPANLKPTPTSSSRIEKRKANTLAARRYRQARLDKVANLEAELKASQRERDALKMQVAKLQGENRVLKDLVRGAPG